MSRYTAADIAVFRSEAVRIGLSAPAAFWVADADALVNVCNGIGSQGAPEWVRDALTFIYREYQASAAIHDCDYEVKEVAKANADRRFKENCLKEWKDAFGRFRWFRPRALAERHKIWLAYDAVRLFGRGAWEANNE